MGRVGREGQGDHRPGVHECGVKKLHLMDECSGKGVGVAKRLASLNIPSGCGSTPSSACIDRKIGKSLSFRRAG